MGDGRGDTSAAEPRIQWQQGACCISFVRRTVELPRAAPGRLAGSRVRRAELKSTSPPRVQRPAEDVPDAQAGAFRPPPKAGFSLVSSPCSSGRRAP
jgi:hypothetical protein